MEQEQNELKLSSFTSAKKKMSIRKKDDYQSWILNISQYSHKWYWMQIWNGIVKFMDVLLILTFNKDDQWLVIKEMGSLWGQNVELMALDFLLGLSTRTRVKKDPLKLQPLPKIKQNRSKSNLWIGLNWKMFNYFIDIEEFNKTGWNSITLKVQFNWASIEYRFRNVVSAKILCDFLGSIPKLVYWFFVI